jgi:hypothetical protein
MRTAVGSKHTTTVQPYQAATLKSGAFGHRLPTIHSRTDAGA